MLVHDTLLSLPGDPSARFLRISADLRGCVAASAEVPSLLSEAERRARAELQARLKARASSGAPAPVRLFLT